MKKRMISLLLALMMCTLLTGTASAANSGSSAVTNARNGVARVVMTFDINVYEPESGEYVGTVQGYSCGSAFGVGTAGKETDVFITNRHVVTEEDGVEELQPGIYAYLEYKISGYYILLDNYAYNSETFTLDTSRAVPCTVIYLGESEDADVAVLKAAENVSGRVALPLLDSEDSLQVADRVSSLGYPGASDQATSEGYLLAGVDDITVNSGAVSRFYDSVAVTDMSSGAITGHVIQHDAAINGQVRIGRDPNGNDLVYPDGTPGISGRHCVVTLSGGQVTLTDLGSSYGTFLEGGQKLTPNQPVTLRVGDGFYLGSEKERFVITGKGGSLT